MVKAKMRFGPTHWMRNYNNESLKELIKKSSVGDWDAIYNLGLCTQNGYGIKKSEQKANFQYERLLVLCESHFDNHESMDKDSKMLVGDIFFNMGIIFMNMVDWKTSREFFEEAMYLYEECALEGDLDALFKLCIYSNHKSFCSNEVYEEHEKWFTIATEALKEASNNGDVHAQYRLGCCYEEKDMKISRKYYELAIENGNEWARYSLAFYDRYHGNRVSSIAIIEDIYAKQEKNKVNDILLISKCLSVLVSYYEDEVLKNSFFKRLPIICIFTGCKKIKKRLKYWKTKIHKFENFL